MTDTTWCFLYGADMNPETIHAEPVLAGARFIDIGSVAAGAVPHLAALEGRVHGIVLAVPGALAGERVAIGRRRDEPVSGVVRTAAADVADLAAVVAEARYWELPVAWWRFLSES
jgi:hypothetical protein